MSKVSSRESKGSGGSSAKGKSQGSSFEKSAHSLPHKGDNPKGSFVLPESTASPSQLKEGAPSDPRTMEWKNFFIESGIPDHAASEYASIFVKERINWPILKNLDKGYLADMGINTIGDQIAILQAAKRYSGEQYNPAKKASSQTVVRMDTDEQFSSQSPAKSNNTKPRSMDKSDMQITSSDSGTRTFTKAEPTNPQPSSIVRSVVKSPADSLSPPTLLIRAKRPVDEDDPKERSIVKRLSALPPKQVVMNSDCNFTVRMGAGPGKRDVFSRLTPKGVRNSNSNNTNLVRVLEAKMSRLSTQNPASVNSIERDKPVVSTLVSDNIERQANVFNRLGNGAGGNERAKITPVTSRIGYKSNGSVFSRLGVAGGNGDSRISSRSNVAAGDLRHRLSIKDRLGARK